MKLLRTVFFQILKATHICGCGHGSDVHNCHGSGYCYKCGCRRFH